MPGNQGAGGRWAIALWAASVVWAAPAAKEPRLAAVMPLAARPGETITATVSGTNLKSLTGVWVQGPGVHAAFRRADDERLEVELSIDKTATAGPIQLRGLGPQGLTNAARFHVVADRVETGQLAKPGDVAVYPIEAKAGETWTFEAISGADSFDPVLSVLTAAPSWFDAGRWERVASEDEDLFFPGLSTNARLIHRFERAGTYRVQVSGFSGQGGPAASYFLRIERGAGAPRAKHPVLRTPWNPRAFVRRVDGEWIAQLHQRAGEKPAPAAAPAEIALGDGTAPALRLPAILDGRIAAPAAAHTARLTIDKITHLAVEIQTPEATLPEFNPIVLIHDASGREVATNVYTKLNNNGLYMMKMIQAKTTFSLTAPGEYTVTVRNITTDHGRPDFHYRVLLREQVPHAGVVTFPDDRLNVTAGRTQVVRFEVEREEEFTAPMVATIEGLPAGVTVLPAADPPVEKPPLPNAGRLERYIGRTQSFALLVAADAAAAVTPLPRMARVVVRPVRDGQLAPPILNQEIPLMIVAAGESK